MKSPKVKKKSTVIKEYPNEDSPKTKKEEDNKIIKKGES